MHGTDVGSTAHKAYDVLNVVCNFRSRRSKLGTKENAHRKHTAQLTGDIWPPLASVTNELDVR